MIARRKSPALDVEEMRARARRKLPRAVYDAIDGGAGDEVTLRQNRAAFGRIALRPRALADVSEVSLATEVLGTPISMPLFLAPCGFARMCDSEAELAVARAAGRTDTLLAVSGAASYSPNEIFDAASGPLWYQLFMAPERAGTETILGAVRDAGYRVLCVTVDAPVAPSRPRDARNRLTFPLEVSPELILSGLSRPAWTWDFLFGRVGKEQGVARAKVAFHNLATTLMHLKSVTLEDLRWLREEWSGPLVVKGIMRGDEVPTMLELGVDGIVVSNHGGRNLDGALASLDALPDVVRAADGRAEVFLDGGIRRGGDVVKALALGARACLIGRPYMFGLAAAGEAGVARILDIFRYEIASTMALAGCAGVAEIDASIVSASAVGATLPAASIDPPRPYGRLT
jgi:isopentenyl diphosphate isomerase/L-lactate dehydrogenase-like FMN-dependent dehydrogenase